MKEKFDRLHYKIRRIKYSHATDIKQMWDVAAFSDADLSQRVFSYIPFGKSNISED